MVRLRHLGRMVHGLTKVLRGHRRMLCEGLWERLLLRRRRRQARDTNVLLLLAKLHVVPSLVVASSSSVHTAVPPVLHGVVATSPKTSGDFRPSFPHVGNHLLDEEAFFRSDGVVVQVGFQVLVIPLPTLLWRPSLNG